MRSVRLCLVVVSLLSCQRPLVLLGSEKIDFGRQIRPILADHCFRCHGPDADDRQADLRLDHRDSAVGTAITPGQASQSELIRRILSADADLQMPPPETNKPLRADQKELLRQWIDQGAEYQTHWSLVPPVRAASPATRDPDHWVRNGVDSFVLARLQQAGVAPAAEATREQWLRRVTMDLTGLPPTLAEIDALLADRSPRAYETVVDRLLNSTAYGERMAADWLDVARYADTFGYQADRDMHVWPWRDWVIAAFNRHMPMDQFVTWQLAGDLLENPSREQLLATAFNRLHRQTNEGGSIEEEFRVEYVADRLRTVGSALLGLTLECARCHDHKYDPITQREYYQLTAFFNNIDEHGLYSHFTETAPTPAMLLYAGDQQPRHQVLLDQIEQHHRQLGRVIQEARQRFLSVDADAEELAPPQPAAHFSFDDAQPSGDYHPVPGKRGQAIEFGGDEAFVCQGAGDFGRTNPFTLSLWVKPGKHAARMVVLHRSRAAEDSAFRGYSLVLDQGHPVFSLVHFWPGNAIQVRAQTCLPEGQWTHLAVSYDGSSQAAGVALFMNGQAAPLDVVRDGLSRDMQHRQQWGDFDVGGVQLALGARFRDVGFKNGAVDELDVFDRQLTTLEIACLAESTEAPSDESRFQHYLMRKDAPFLAARAELQQLRGQENELVSQVRQIMIMREMPHHRPTFVLARGAYDARQDAVSPATPLGLTPMAADLPRNRLGLAKWLLDPSNPLTARVMVNRLWQVFFGRGLVASSEDFGSQGQLPSHPELLDWLATSLIDHEWDPQAICRLIALSATYRQDSMPVDPAILQSDPDNRLFAHGPRHRLSGEQLRDNALAVSGLLSRTVGGPSVFPYQPAGLWEESGTGKSYHQSTGEGLYRRSMYTFWRRTAPPPTMITFDAPSREYCVTRRERTATPLQALTLLNDPQFVEASRVLAQRLMQQHQWLEERLTRAFRLLTSRRPTDNEIKLLAQIHDDQLRHFAGAPEDARRYVEIGEAPRDDTLDPIAQAALTAVIQALMSFDECVMKR